MKNKVLYLLPCLALVSCGISTNNSANPNYFGNSDILITEFLVGNSVNNRAVEISNLSGNEILLDDYKLCIYKSNASNPHINIDLNGYKIGSKSTFIIVYSKSDEDLKAKSNLITDDLMVDGTWPISLNYKDKIVDVLGTIGYGTEYGKAADLVRKTEYLNNRYSFDAFEWLKFHHDDYSHLGTYSDIGLTDEEIIYGPRLTEEMAKLPFVGEDGNGGGGFTKVELAYTGDGDTTNFYFDSSLEQYGIRSRESIRYHQINTPEIQHGNSIDAQPWGEEAKKYNNQILNNAKHFIIQCEKGGALRETYGRMLCYVWYANVDNPQLSDYRCLNNEMLRVGLAFTYFTNDLSYNIPLMYKGLSYATIFKNTELNAKKQGLKVHGEKDPSFNY